MSIESSHTQGSIFPNMEILHHSDIFVTTFNLHWYIIITQSWQFPLVI